ncbi:MAG: hypothetical protein ACP5I3_11890, partial [Thermoproteus sp.]
LLQYNASYTPIYSGPADGGTATLTLNGTGAVAGWAIYLMRNGTWRLADFKLCPKAVLDLSQVWPWDPVAVVPIIDADVTITLNSSLVLPMPEMRVYARWWPPFPEYGTPSQPRLYCAG